MSALDINDIDELNATLASAKALKDGEESALPEETQSTLDLVRAERGGVLSGSPLKTFTLQTPDTISQVLAAGYFDQFTDITGDCAINVEGGDYDYNLKIVDGVVSVVSGGSVVFAAQFGIVPEVDTSAVANRVIQSLSERGGGVIMYAAGLYIHNNVRLRENVTLIGGGKGVTIIQRTANNPVFYADGGAYLNTQETLPIYNTSLSKMTVTSDVNYSSDLVDMKAITSSIFEGVEFNANSCRLAVLHQVWDSRFNNCFFLNGANGSTLLKSGGGDYKQTKEIIFDGCVWESYVNQAVLNTSESNLGGKKTEMIGFVNCKFESKYTSTRHIDMYTVSGITFVNTYVTTYLTDSSSAVVSVGNGHNLKGDLTFYHSDDVDLAHPKSLLRVVAATNVDFKVSVGALQDPATWAVEWDGVNADKCNFDIYAPYPTVNGRYQGQKTLRNSTVEQKGTANDAVQYLFTKEGRLQWSLGNLNNPTSDWEDFYMRASGVNMLTARVKGNTPATDEKELITGGFLTVGSDWDGGRLLRMGGYTFHVDSSKNIRVTEGDPSSETDGVIVATLP